MTNKPDKETAGNKTDEINGYYEREGSTNRKFKPQTRQKNSAEKVISPPAEKNQSQEKPSDVNKGSPSQMPFAEVNNDGHPDALRGIFDTTDLDKVLKKIKFHSGEDYIGIYDNKIEIQGIEDKDFFKLIKTIQKEERQRLRKEVEKIIDELFYDKPFTYGKIFITKEELKKRLF